MTLPLWWCCDVVLVSRGILVLLVFPKAPAPPPLGMKCPIRTWAGWGRRTACTDMRPLLLSCYSFPHASSFRFQLQRKPGCGLPLMGPHPERTLQAGGEQDKTCSRLLWTLIWSVSTHSGSGLVVSLSWRIEPGGSSCPINCFCHEVFRVTWGGSPLPQVISVASGSDSWRFRAMLTDLMVPVALFQEGPSAIVREAGDKLGRGQRQSWFWTRSWTSSTVTGKPALQEDGMDALLSSGSKQGTVKTTNSHIL